MLFCPNCGKKTVSLVKATPEESYYENKRDKYHCSDCLASFDNYNDGSQKRRNREIQEQEEIETYKRLKAKFENK